MAGDTFDAGTVYATSELDRKQFQKDVRQIRKDLRELAKDAVSIPVRLNEKYLKADWKRIQREMQGNGLTIKLVLNDGDIDRQMRALQTKYARQQFVINLKLSDAAFDAEAKRVEARMKSMRGISVPVDLNEQTLDAELAKLSAQLSRAEKPIVVPLDLATEEAHAKEEAFRATANSPAVIPLDANTTRARTKFEAFRAWVKKRAIEAVLDIKVKDVKKFIGWLGMMSYRISALGRGFDAAGKFADRNLMKMTMGLVKATGAATMLFLQFAKFGGAALGAATMGSAVLGLAGNLTQAGWAAAALPGFILTMVAGVQAFKVGVSGVGEALKNAFDPKNAQKLAEAMKELHPEAQKFVKAIQGVAKAWSAMKKDVQGALFKDLSKEIKPLSDLYLPIIGKTLETIAGGFNRAGKEIAGFLKQAETVRTVAVLGDDIALTWGSITQMLRPLISIFLDLAAVALPFLRDTAAYLVPVVQGWADAVHQMRMSSELATKMSRGFDVLLMVLGLLQNAWSILRSVMDAASRSGFGMIEVYAQMFGAAARFLQTAEGMKMLDSIFRTIAQALAIAQPFLSAFGSMLIDYVLPAVLQALPGIAAAFAALAPAMGPLGQIIAALLPVIVQLAQAFAGQLASAIITLAPYILGFLNMLKENPAAAAAVVGALGVLGFAFTHLGTILSLIGKIFVFNKLRQTLVALGGPAKMVDGFLGKLLGKMSFMSRIVGMILGPIGLLIGAFIAMYMNSASFRDAINGLIGVLFTLIGSALQPFMEIFAALAPIIGYVAGVLGDALAPVINGISWALSFLAPVIKVLTYAWIAWTVATWALNSALLANPITWIVIGIIALIVAIVALVRNWDTVVAAIQAGWAAFVGFIQPVLDWFKMAWQAISDAVSTAWNSYIWPVLQAIGNVLKWIGAIVLTVLLAPFVIAWNLISAIAVWAWNTMLKPIFDMIGNGLRQLGDFFVWLYTFGVLPIWNAIVAVIQYAWGVIQYIWAAIQYGIAYLGYQFNILYYTYVLPAWNLIMAVIQYAWAYVSSIFNSIVDAVSRFLGPIFSWLYDNIIKPVWDAIVSAIETAWGVIKTIFDILMLGVRKVGDAFSEVKDWIGRQWAEIKELTRVPVKFVVDTVYNNGIRTVWNGIAGLFGLPALNPVTMAVGGVVSWKDTMGAQAPATMATGGVLGGYQPGRDSVLTMLSPGEGVLVPEAVKALGPGFVHWANSFFAKGRVGGGNNHQQDEYQRMHNFTRNSGPRKYATGGVVSDGVIGRVDPSIANALNLQAFAGGGIVDSVTGFFGDAADALGQMFTDPVGAIRKLFDNVLGMIIPGKGSWTDALMKLPPKVIEAAIAKVKKIIDEMLSMGGGGNWMPVIGQALTMRREPLSLAGTTHRRMMQESGGNPTAVNRYDVNWQRGHPSVGLMQIIGPTYAANAGPFRNVGPFMYGTSINPLAQFWTSMAYAKGRYGSLSAAYNKGNGYKNGGMLHPGEVGFNETGKPEYVFNQDQWNTLVRAGSIGTPESVKSNVVRKESKGSGNIEQLNVYANSDQKGKEIWDEFHFGWKSENHGKYGGGDR